jgi:hypothetical protein
MGAVRLSRESVAKQRELLGGRRLGRLARCFAGARIPCPGSTWTGVGCQARSGRCPAPGPHPLTTFRDAGRAPILRLERLPLRPLLQQVGLGAVFRKAGCKDPSGSEACEGRSTRLHAPGVGQSEGTSPHRSEGPPPSLMEADRRRHRAHRSGSCRPTRCDCAIGAPNIGGSSPQDAPALLLTAAMPPGSPAEPAQPAGDQR